MFLYYNYRKIHLIIIVIIMLFLENFLNSDFYKVIIFVNWLDFNVFKKNVFLIFNKNFFIFIILIIKIFFYILFLLSFNYFLLILRFFVFFLELDKLKNICKKLLIFYLFFYILCYYIGIV